MASHLRTGGFAGEGLAQDQRTGIDRMGQLLLHYVVGLCSFPDPVRNSMYVNLLRYARLMYPNKTNATALMATDGSHLILTVSEFGQMR